MTLFQETEDSIRQVNIPRPWPVVIAQGGTIGTCPDLDQYVICAIQMSAAWTAANLTFQARVSPEVAWMGVYDTAGDEFVITAAAGRFIILDPADFAGLRHLRVRSGTTGTPVEQAGERTLYVMVRPV